MTVHGIQIHRVKQPGLWMEQRGDEELHKFTTDMMEARSSDQFGITKIHHTLTE